VRRTQISISVGKDKLKFKNDLTSLDDKLRIANKVNDKYLDLEKEKITKLKDLCFEIGDEYDRILANYPNHIKDIDGAHVSFANDKQEQSSTTSERTTTQMDSGVESSNSDSNRRSDGYMMDPNISLINPNENNNHKLESLPAGYSENNNLASRGNAVTVQNGVKPCARIPMSTVCLAGNGVSHNQEGVQQIVSDPEAKVQHQHLAVSELSASYDGICDQFCQNKSDAIAHQRLYEAQRDLSPMYQKQPECCSQAHKMHLSDHHGRCGTQSYGTGLDISEMEHDSMNDHHSHIHRRKSCPNYDQNNPRKTKKAVKGSNQTPLLSPEGHRQFTPEYFEGSSSTLSSVSEDLYCSARADKTYYRVDPGDNMSQSKREDQATQTDDEAEIDTPKKIMRPTNFKCGKDFRGQVRSQEELSRKETILGSIIDLQDHSGLPDGLNKPLLCKTGSLCYPHASRSCHSGSFSTHHLNGLDSQQIVPIFHKLLEDKSISSLTESSPSCPSNMVSCPNIAVRCDIVEYL